MKSKEKDEESFKIGRRPEKERDDERVRGYESGLGGEEKRRDGI
jgi:hypothetical protein